MSRPKATWLITEDMQKQCFAHSAVDRIAAATDLGAPVAGEMTGPVQLEAIQDAEIIITGWGTQSITVDMLDAAPGLKLMCHAAGSVKHLVTEAFVERGIRVCSARTALAKGVAEFSFGLMLTCMKGAFQFHAATLAGEWDRSRHMDAVCEPHGATVGIVGASSVGREMIKWCRMLDLGALLVYDPYLTEDAAKEMGVELVALDELMKRSDVVSLHTPNTDECAAIIKAGNLALMRDGAIFINTARGRCVDEAALIAELRKGRIFACLDVTDPEPPEAGSPFYDLPNCVLTPHIAGSIKQNCQRQGALVADQIVAFTAGEAMPDELDLGQMYRYA